MKKLHGSFRNTQWDPWLIIAQIVSMQCLLYLTLGLIIALFNTLLGDTRSLDHLFEYHEIHVRDISGRITISAFVLNSFIGALVLWMVVERTKQCLDFSCTWHIIHLLICWIYNAGFPTSLSWWLLNAACVAFMCVFGELLCMRTELREIPLSLGPKADL